jgi:hypothetical protein
MNSDQAKQLIENALNQATLKGCYNLQEIAQILEALKIMYYLDKSEEK